MELEIWRLHPGGCRVEKAEKTVKGTANEGATKWCAPYSQANSLGWLIYPPTDIDIIWKSPKTFEYRHISDYNDYDHHFVRGMIREEDQVNPNRWCPPGGRTKFTWGAADDNVVQIWTGMILKTPPGWCLQIRSPINCELPHRFHNVGPICSIQEGLLETDWMQYDIWINVQFHVQNKWVYLRRSQALPLAQLVPVHRDSMSGWTKSERAVTRSSPEGEAVFKFWIDYNHQKYGSGGNQHASAEHPEVMKDSTTYFRERQASRCPYLKAIEGIRTDETPAA